MRRQIAATIALSIVVVAVTSKPSVSGNLTYRQLGAGALSCGAFLKQEHVRNGVMQWVLGFVTGFNIVRAAATKSSETADILNGADADAVEVWLANYCKTNPLHDIASAAVALTIEVTAPK